MAKKPDRICPRAFTVLIEGDVPSAQGLAALGVVFSATGRIHLLGDRDPSKDLVALEWVRLRGRFRTLWNVDLMVDAKPSYADVIAQLARILGRSLLFEGDSDDDASMFQVWPDGRSAPVLLDVAALEDGRGDLLSRPIAEVA